MRINKYLAHEGHTTRRGADELIVAGKVFVNNVPAVVGQKITEKDVVELRNVEKKRFRYILYNKPRGIITHSPGDGETDIETKIRADHGLTGVFPIGRLDKESEGLILLTDDGRVTERLLSPDKEHEKEYEVTVDKKVTGSLLTKLEAGVDIEGYVTRPTKALKMPKDPFKFRIVLTEGKKHQVRRMCAALGYQVTSLRRVRIANLLLGPLKRGAVRELTKTQRDRFLRSLGIR